MKKNDLEFKRLIEKKATRFFEIGNLVLNNEIPLSQKFDMQVMQEILLLEIFLDNYGARTNKKYIYFTELVASIRNFTNIMYTTKHIFDRVSFYQVEENKKAEENLKEKINEFYLWSIKSFKRLYDEAFKEAKRLNIAITKKVLTGDFLGEEECVFQLEHNVEIDEVELGIQRILEITHKYRKVAKSIHRENFGKRVKPKDFETLIPLRVDEKKARKFQNILHGVQSDYDTYVKGSLEEKKHSNLKTLRGFIAMPMHLLQILSWLSHFYERHLPTVRKTEIKKKMSSLIDNNELIHFLVYFTMNTCHKYLHKGNEIAEQILTYYSKPITIELPVPEPIGFHARPSHYISLIVNEFGTDVFLVVNGQEYSCKSVMNLLQAGGEIAELGLKKVTFKGDEKVLNHIKILAEHNYCEDNDIPPELNYLRIARNFL